MITFPPYSRWKATGISLIAGFVIAWLTLPAVPAYAQGPICRVDSDVATPGNGSTWPNAYQHLQDALAQTGCTEIWVAASVYYPDEGTGQLNNNRSSSYVLTNSVTIYGGFDTTETSRNERDQETNITVLSGDIDQNDTTDTNHITTDTAHIVGGNAYHVVKGGDGTILDGFTVTGGSAFGEPSSGGGGGGNSTTADAILANEGANTGGGILNFQGGPTIENVTIIGNQAGKGGGMYNMVARSTNPNENLNVTQATLINVTFENNYGAGRGGGISNDLYSHPVMTNVIFTNNSTDGKGGGIYNDWNASPKLTNCLFVGNRANRGGAIGNDGSSSPTIINCTFTQNHADDQGAALYQGSYKNSPNNPIVTNSILWGNTLSYSGAAEISNWHENNPQVTFSIVEGSYSGTSNLADNPQFVDAAQGDYRLSNTSPAIDAGTSTNAPTTDLNGASRNAIPDIGAYETVVVVSSSDYQLFLPLVTKEISGN